MTTRTLQLRQTSIIPTDGRSNESTSHCETVNSPEPTYRIYFRNNELDPRQGTRRWSLVVHPRFVHAKLFQHNTADEDFLSIPSETMHYLCDIMPLLGYLLTKRSVPTDASNNGNHELLLDPALGVSKQEFHDLIVASLDSSGMSVLPSQEIQDTADKLGGSRLFCAHITGSRQFVKDRTMEKGWSLVGELSLQMGTIPEE